MHISGLNNNPKSGDDSSLLGDEMSFIFKATIQLSEKKPIQNLLDDVITSSRKVLHAEESSLVLFNENNNKLYFQVATGDKGTEVKAHAVDLGVGIAGWVAQNRTPLRIDDCYADSRFNPEFDNKINFRTKSMICAPMIHKEKLIGVLQVINKHDGQTFTPKDLEVLQILALQCATSIENARLMEFEADQKAIQHELDIARQIQLHMLPENVNIFTDLDVAGQLVPAKQVGGDYYNVHTINNDTTLFIVCDVSGKSISAALIVSTISATIRTYIETYRSNLKLSEMVSCLNKILIDTTTSEKFATCWFGLYEHSTHTLHSINAGHNTIFLQKKTTGIIEELRKGGFVLGAIELPYETEIHTLNIGDRILWYTDGVPEAMNVASELFGDERMLHRFTSSTNATSEDTVNLILSDIQLFTKDAIQSDDITCGIITVLK